MSTQLYWDGNSGALEHSNKSAVFDTKPDIAGVQFDTLTYDTEEGTRTKTIGKQLFELTPEEISAVQNYAEKNVSPLGTLDTLVTQHNTDPESHQDIREQLSTLQRAFQELSAKASTFLDTETVLRG